MGCIRLETAVSWYSVIAGSPMFHQVTTADVVPGVTASPLTTPIRTTPMRLFTPGTSARPAGT
jgi:hypothetical protein